MAQPTRSQVRAPLLGRAEKCRRFEKIVPVISADKLHPKTRNKHAGEKKYRRRARVGAARAKQHCHEIRCRKRTGTTRFRLDSRLRMADRRIKNTVHRDQIRARGRLPPANRWKPPPFSPVRRPQTLQQASHTDPDAGMKPTPGMGLWRRTVHEAVFPVDIRDKHATDFSRRGRQNKRQETSLPAAGEKKKHTQLIDFVVAYGIRSASRSGYGSSLNSTKALQVIKTMPL